MTDIKPAVDFVTPMAITGCVACPWFFVLYYINRKIYPIAQREPMITLSANVAFWAAAQIWMLELNHYAIPCIVDTFAVQILAGITLVLMFMKVWKIYMDSGLTNELEKEQYGWFVAHRSLRSRRSLNTLMLSMTSVHCVLFVVAVVSDSEHAFQRANTCDGTTSGLILAGLAVIYVIVFVMASCKLAKVKDNYFIKSELRMVGIGSGSLSLGYLAKVAADLPCVLPECTTMLLWFCWIACFLASTMYPLTKAMWDRKFLWWWDLCRKKSLQQAKEQLCNNHTDRDISYADSMASRTESSFIGDDTIIEFKNPIYERNPMRVLSSHLSPRDPALAKLKKVPLARLLSFGPGKEAFRRFAVMEFSVENLLFVEAVHKFRSLDDPNKRDVQDLYDKFVSSSAPSQVNLPIKVVRKMTNNLPTIDGVEIRAFFDEAMDHVMKLMQRDSYRRFQDTTEFAALAVEMEGFRLSISHQPPPAATTATTATAITTTTAGGDESVAAVEMASILPLTPTSTTVPQTPHSPFALGATSTDSPRANTQPCASSSSSPSSVVTSPSAMLATENTTTGPTTSSTTPTTSSNVSITVSSALKSGSSPPSPVTTEAPRTSASSSSLETFTSNNNNSRNSGSGNTAFSSRASLPRSQSTNDLDNNNIDKPRMSANQRIPSGSSQEIASFSNTTTQLPLSTPVSRRNSSATNERRGSANNEKRGSANNEKRGSFHEKPASPTVQSVDLTRQPSRLSRVSSDSAEESSMLVDSPLHAPLRQFVPETLSFNSSDSVTVTSRSSSSNIQHDNYQLLE